MSWRTVIIEGRCKLDYRMGYMVARTAVSHGYHIIGIESMAHPMLALEKRTIIDSDLCEMG